MGYALVVPRRDGKIFYIADRIQDTLKDAKGLRRARQPGAAILWVTKETVRPIFTREEVSALRVNAENLAVPPSLARAASL